MVANVRFGGFTLGVERVELLIEPFFRRFASVDRATNGFSLDSSSISRSAVTHRWIPRSMISAIDRKRTNAGSLGSSPSSGRVSKEKASMIPSP